MTTVPELPPLADIKVLDIASFMAAPMTAMWLGDFGADVIKIEHPDGDMMRGWGSLKNDVPLFWKMVARNKRSVTLDLHKAQGQEILRRMVAKADVLVENFRPGTLERWGLAYDTLQEINPRLVMLSISAFGKTGRYSSRAGFGTLAEAMSGYAHVTGQPDGPPTLPSFGLADAVTGLCGAFAVMVALHERDTVSGKGQAIDLGIYEPMLTMLGHHFVDFDQLGIVAGRMGSRLPFASPRNAFKTQDGDWVAMSCSTQSVFVRACNAIGRPELITDVRYVNNQTRTENSETLDAVFADWISTHPTADVLATLNDAGAAVAPIYDVRGVFEDEHFRDRESIVAVDDQDLGSIRMQNVVPKLSRTPGGIRHAGPRLGEHTREVYADWLGVSDGELAQLTTEGVI
jgi:crotonobetainyl-CoA:carnitine CoA-transferase CaiB-like acyl-CoA transferase